MQLFIVGFTTLIKRSSETLAALSSFLNIPNWAANFTFPVPRKHTNYDTGIRCTDRDRLVRGEIVEASVACISLHGYPCHVYVHVYVCAGSALPGRVQGARQAR